MIDVNINTSPCADPKILIGRQEENNAVNVVFDLSFLIQNFGEGTAVLVHQRTKDNAPYIVTTQQDGSTLSWKVSNIDTAYVGVGQAELRWTVGDTLAKTIIYKTWTVKSITGDAVMPDPYRSWYDAMIAYIDNASVSSVNGKTGTVVLNASDVSALPSSTVIPVIDDTLTHSAEAADAKATGDKISVINENMLYNGATDKLQSPFVKFVLGNYINAIGTNSTGNPKYATSNMKYVNGGIIRNYSPIYADSGRYYFNCHVHEYDMSGQWIQRQKLTEESEVTLSGDTKFIRIVVGVTSTSGHPVPDDYVLTENVVNEFDAYIIQNKFETISGQSIKVMSFNVRGYNSPENDAQLVDSNMDPIYFRRILNRGDLVFTQEDRIYYSKTDDILTRDYIFKNYDYGYIASYMTNDAAYGNYGKGIYANIPAYSLTGITFSNQAPNTWSSFATGLVSVFNNDEIRVISCHLAPGSNHAQYRKAQIQEMIDYTENDKYVIICGDFNTATEDELSTFGDEWERFNYGFYGQMVTTASNHYYDNIIVKNAKILHPEVVVDGITHNDHYPIRCEVLLKRNP